jgi:adenylate cyclase
LRYFFEKYALDTDRRELRRGVDLISITPQVFDLLEFLIRNRERVVSKDDLIAAIWGGRIVSDAALTTRLNVARHAIGDSGAEQRLIKTLPKKGIRFVGAVRKEPEHAVGISPQPPALPHGPSIAVLPFTVTPDGHDREFLSDSIADDLITELSKLRGLHVVARNASFAFREKNADVWRIGDALGVNYVLEGSARRMDGRLRITGRLIDAATGVHVWAARYERPNSDSLSARDEITETMVAAIAPAIVYSERQRALRKPPENLGVWDVYQRGMWHMSKCEPAENHLARAFFQRATELDPTYAPAHSALAWSYMMSASIFSEMSIAEGCILGEPLVRKAIALDESDVEPRARLALSALLQGDLEGAFEEAEQVLSVNGYCADALGVKGAALIYSGRREEGRQAIHRYLRLSPSDPARPIRLSQIAASQYLDENYASAALTARQIIRHYPKHPLAYRWLAAALGQLDRAAEAEQALQSLLTLSPSSLEMYVRQRPQYCSIEYAPMLAGLRKAGWKD